MLGPTHTAEEDAAYEMAEQLRKSILGGKCFSLQQRLSPVNSSCVGN